MSQEHGSRPDETAAHPVGSDSSCLGWGAVAGLKITKIPTDVWFGKDAGIVTYCTLLYRNFLQTKSWWWWLRWRLWWWCLSASIHGEFLYIVYITALAASLATSSIYLQQTTTRLKSSDTVAIISRTIIAARKYQHLLKCIRLSCATLACLVQSSSFTIVFAPRLQL